MIFYSPPLTRSCQREADGLARTRPKGAATPSRGIPRTLTRHRRARSTHRPNGPVEIIAKRDRARDSNPKGGKGRTYVNQLRRC